MGLFFEDQKPLSQNLFSDLIVYIEVKQNLSGGQQPSIFLIRAQKNLRDQKPIFGKFHW